jgi:hypothetical protein
MYCTEYTQILQASYITKTARLGKEYTETSVFTFSWYTPNIIQSDILYYHLSISLSLDHLSVDVVGKHVGRNFVRSSPITLYTLLIQTSLPTPSPHG